MMPYYLQHYFGQEHMKAGWDILHTDGDDPLDSVQSNLAVIDWDVLRGTPIKESTYEPKKPEPPPIPIVPVPVEKPWQESLDELVEVSSDESAKKEKPTVELLDSNARLAQLFQSFDRMKGYK